jgi:hypothetical protein
MNVETVIARLFGEADERDQATHLNLLGEQLWLACKCRESTVEKQLCYTARHLNQHGKRLVTMLAEFVKLQDEGVRD